MVQELCIQGLVLLTAFQQFESKPIASQEEVVLPNDELITVDADSGQFLRGSIPYKFAGLNFWNAPYIDFNRLTKELDLLERYNITNFRIMALSEGGPINADVERIYGPRRIDPAVSNDPCSFEPIGNGVDIGLFRHAKNLQRVLVELGKRGMSAVLILNNEYYWSGGMPQYMKWVYEAIQNKHNQTNTKDCYDQFDQPHLAHFLFHPELHSLESLHAHGKLDEFFSDFEFKYDDKEGCYMESLNPHFEIPHPNIFKLGSDPRQKAWNDLMHMSQLFMCSRRAQYYYLRRVHKLIQLVTSTGTIKERAYVRNAIMSWQIANEPRCFNGWDLICTHWINSTVRLVKSVDREHLVSLGSEGLLPQAWKAYANIGYVGYHVGTGLDYLTIHAWPENWKWYSKNSRDLEYAKKQVVQYINRHLMIASHLKFPMVLEESGLARDGEYDIYSKTTQRDDYFDFLVKLRDSTQFLEGLNFWAWGGYGLPSKLNWHRGDDKVGDPPHEYQGWYSIFEYDDSTLQIIGNAN